MRFANDRQRGTVCRAIMRHARLVRLWSGGPGGYEPTAECETYVRHTPRGDIPDARPGMAHSQHLLFDLAWDVWNGTGGFSLAEAVVCFDAANLRMLGALIIAMTGGDAAIDAWLDVFGKETR